MFDEKDEKSLKQELENKPAIKEDDVQINVTSKRKRFDSFKIRYKKDKKKYLVAISALCAMLSMTMGSSYAYLKYVSKTNNTVVLDAGTLALTFQNEQNIISLENAVPVKDQVGLQQEQEYSFDIRNNGTIPASYTITLDNICTTGNGIDACIPDEYIKVGLKVGSSDYKVIERNEKSKYIIETGSLAKGGYNSYKMKVWLDHNTPNTYNAQNNQNIVYKGKLGLTYEQGKINLASEINSVNYTVTHYQNRTTSEIKNDASFDGLTNQPYYRIHGNSSTSAIDTSWQITGSNDISVVAGSKYTLSFYVRSENAQVTQYIDSRNVDQNMTHIIWNDNTKTKLSSVKNFDNDGQWHLITDTITVPQGVTSGRINIGNDNPNLYGENSYIDIANIRFTDK